MKRRATVSSNSTRWSSPTAAPRWRIASTLRSTSRASRWRRNVVSRTAAILLVDLYSKLTISLVRTDRGLGLPPCRRRRADHAPERPIERSIRVISNTPGDLAHAKGAVLQQMLRQVHSPAGEILNGGFADQFDEAFRERRTRDPDFLCKRFDGPRPIRLSVKQGEGGTHLGVIKASQPPPWPCATYRNCH